MKNSTKNKLFSAITVIVLFFISLMYDRQILLFITALRFDFLNKFIIYFDKVDGLVILSFFFLYFLIKKEYQTIKPYIANIIIVYVGSYLIKFLVHRPRPGIEFFPLIIKSGSSAFYSFPSGHVIAAFSILPFLETKKEKIVWLVIAFVIGISRLYLGVHYLSDVIAGILIGLAFALLAKKIAYKPK